MSSKSTLFFTLVIGLFVSCVSTASNNEIDTISNPIYLTDEAQTDLDSLSTAYFASGCFWCVEAVFESIKGVAEAESGYSGGTEKNPTYHNLGSHAETVKVYYDSSVVDFPTLLEAYYGSQDPTTKGQKPDFGEHYRSIIFYQNETEKKLAEEKKSAIKGAVTEIKKFEIFYIAEDYHQNYERLHPEQSYVKAVSIPRLNRFKEKHKSILKE